MSKTEKNELTPEAAADAQRARGLQMLPWVLVILVVLAAAIFFAMQYRRVQSLSQQLDDLKANPQRAAEDQTKDLLDKVGKLIVLPDETPTIATVSDLEALKDQPFFANAEVGDKVLIYTQAKKAILFSEKLNKIKEVAPVNLGDSTTGTSTDTSIKKPANANSNTSTNGNTNTNKAATNANK